jgi:hypothetical protein
MRRASRTRFAAGSGDGWCSAIQLSENSGCVPKATARIPDIAIGGGKDVMLENKLE